MLIHAAFTLMLLIMLCSLGAVMVVCQRLRDMELAVLDTPLVVFTPPAGREHRRAAPVAMSGLVA